MEPARSNPLKNAFRPLVVAALALVAACQQPQPQGNEPVPAPEPEPHLPIVPRLESFDRGALLAAVAQAASAHAAGADDSAAQRTLDGRQFEFRIRFGCRGPSTELREQWLGWSFDEESRTLRVRAMPTLAREDPLVRDLGGASFEAVEGFWIPRPWLLESVCPATAAIAPSPAADSHDEQPAPKEASITSGKKEQLVAEPLPRWPRIGIAHFFSETDPRTGRRSMRPYEAVKTLDPGQSVGSQGFNLVLSGRLRALPGKGVILCTAKGAQSPPECIVSADFDRVWIELPGTKQVIAEWSSS